MLLHCEVHVIEPNQAAHAAGARAQMDLLEHGAIDDVIVCGVVLEEVRHRNASAYQRLRALVDAPRRRFFVFVNEHHRCPAALLCMASHARTPGTPLLQGLWGLQFHIHAHAAEHSVAMVLDRPKLGA